MAAAAAASAPAAPRAKPRRPRTAREAGASGAPAEARRRACERRVRKPRKARDRSLRRADDDADEARRRRARRARRAAARLVPRPRDVSLGQADRLADVPPERRAGGGIEGARREPGPLQRLPRRRPASGACRSAPRERASRCSSSAASSSPASTAQRPSAEDPVRAGASGGARARARARHPERTPPGAAGSVRAQQAGREAAHHCSVQRRHRVRHALFADGDRVHAQHRVRAAAATSQLEAANRATTSTTRARKTTPLIQDGASVEKATPRDERDARRTAASAAAERAIDRNRVGADHEEEQARAGRSPSR